MELSKEQIDFIKKTLSGKKVNTKKLMAYLEEHEVVEEKVFEECKSDDDRTFYIESVSLFRKRAVGYLPVPVETFIKRLPLFYYRDDRGKSFRSWLSKIIDNSEDGFEEELEKMYQLLELFYYDHGITVEDMMKYPRIQLNNPEKANKNPFECDIDDLFIEHSRITQKKFLYQWSDYIDLCKNLGWSDYFPERFITRYNEALEASGYDPIIYEYYSKDYELDLHRKGNRYIFKGHFPCDGLGRPIMKWIGIKVENAGQIRCSCEKSRPGQLVIEIKPDTMIYTLWCNVPISEANSEIVEENVLWNQEYAGPLNMFFNHESLKTFRIMREMTQKEVADAIGASVRTYQKWENGDTKPDCQYLLRIMNWLQIDNVQDLISYKNTEEDTE